MKKIFAIVIVLLLVFGVIMPFFTGCEPVLNENGETVFTDGGRFVVVEHNERWDNTFENWIVKDSQTGFYICWSKPAQVIATESL